MFKNFVAASANTPDQKSSPLDFDEEPVNIGLVLTGGGSHGAYEAGVLEAILPALERLGKISGITGTSAGAVNAIAAGSGLNAAGPDEAAHRLRGTWGIVKNSGNFFGRSMRFFSDTFLPSNQKWPNLPSVPFTLSGTFQEFSPSFAAQFISGTVKKIARNWDKEVQSGDVKIYVNTVLEKRNELGTFEHVILSGDDLTPDGVGASANLKQLGCHYIRDTHNPDHLQRRAFDGAYKENGSLTPHFENNVTDCIMIILHDRRHNTLDKGDLKHAEIHSNALELAISDASVPMRFHAIEIESMGGEIGGLSHMDDSSKLNTDAEFIDLLYQSGLKAGQEWLKKNENYIGQMSSYSFYKPALEQYAEMNCT